MEGKQLASVCWCTVTHRAAIVYMVLISLWKFLDFVR
jgi:hypothetical protein